MAILRPLRSPLRRFAFVLGQEFGVHCADTGLGGQSVGGAGVVAGEHRGVDAQIA
jgi:hypothetical protein